MISSRPSRPPKTGRSLLLAGARECGFLPWSTRRRTTVGGCCWSATPTYTPTRSRLLFSSKSVRMHWRSPLSASCPNLWTLSRLIEQSDFRFPSSSTSPGTCVSGSWLWGWGTGRPGLGALHLSSPSFSFQVQGPKPTKQGQPRKGTTGGARAREKEKAGGRTGIREQESEN